MFKISLILIFIFLFCISGFSKDKKMDVVNYKKILEEMRNNYEDWGITSDGRPIGDFNRTCAGFRKLKTEEEIKQLKRVTFSETVSYSMFLYVMAEKNNEKARDNFIKVWEWSRHNLQRKNVQSVFNWCTKQIQPMKEESRDSLFCWRWLDEIEGTDFKGIIYQENKDKDDNRWHGATECAVDGDILIAYSLLLGHKKGWAGKDGESLKDEAILIIRDIRKKCTSKFSAGELINIDNPIPENFVKKDYPLDGINWPFLIYQFKNHVNLKAADSIKIEFSGQGAFAVQLSDDQKRAIETEPIIFKKKVKNKTVVIPLKNEKFHRNIYYGKQSCKDDFDWEKVTSIQITLNPNYRSGAIQLKKLSISNIKNQTQNNRRYLLINNNGNYIINVSYYMPFAFKAFAEIDNKPEVWLELLKENQATLNTARNIPEMRGLYPDFFHINYTGEIIENENIAGKDKSFKFGYDAFRTIYFQIFSSINNKEKLDPSLYEIKDLFTDKSKAEIYKDKISMITNDPGMLITFINLFHVTGKKDAADKYMKHLMENMKRTGKTADNLKNITFFTGPPEQGTDGGRTDYYKFFWSYFNILLWKTLNEK